MLQGEARKILRRHASRLPAPVADELRASVAAVDTYRGAKRWDALEDEAERLDELLHQHASFARKSALRETLENVGIAVAVALMLRSCIYEPYKIPSGSMIPTLQTGDHIFVNKFVYGIQIPFTSTVVGQDALRSVGRGDVVVFRWPIDPRDDYIKRVIGLPGDSIRVDGRELWIKARGAAEFQPVERRPLEEPCTGEDGGVLRNCELFQETLGDHSYTVRFSGAFEGLTPAATYTVPEGHLFVMGDNRDESHDSRAWTVELEAVNAASLITEKDLRDLTDADEFTRRNPADSVARRRGTGEGGADRDRVLYLAEHRAVENNLELELWRNPDLGDRAVFSALRGQLDEASEVTVPALIERGVGVVGLERDRAVELGAEIDELVVAETADSRVALWRHDPTRTVFRLTCGKYSCKTTAQLAVKLTDVLRRFHRDHDADAPALLPEDKSVRYVRHFTARDELSERFAELRFGRGDGPEQQVRLRAYRDAGPGARVLRDAALASLGATISSATPAPELGDQAYVVATEESFALVQVDPDKRWMTLLQCGRARCGSARELIELGRLVDERRPEAQADRRRMATLLTGADLPGFRVLPATVPSLDPWDRVTLTGARSGGEHSFELELQRRPPEGIAAALAALRADFRSPEQVAGLGSEAWRDKGTGRYLFSVAETELVVSLQCGAALCPDEESALTLARRAADKAADPRHFVDPRRAVSRPFVPRGNVKGRADMIWLPRGRFGKKID